MSENIVNLTELKKNESGYIIAIKGNEKIKTRLEELGFTKGTLVKIINVSSLKESYLVEVRNYLLALRKNAVNLISVVKKSEKEIL